MNLYLDEQILSLIIVIASAIILLLLILVTILLVRMKKFEKAYISLQTFMSKDSLEDLLKANLGEIREAKQKIQVQETKINKIENKVECAVDNVGLVKFNSFDHMGADLSFALALLDQEGTGVLLTSIQSIEECRIYAKAIEKGRAAVKLIEEEKTAIEKACLNAKKI
ncbi:MAG: DUF4446 family protein [Peptococcaceae bacterium]|nr:DUF4446 family protein [Peptococcaceae bacterium]